MPCWRRRFRNFRPPNSKRRRGNLFIGLVVNEYLEDFHRGDFLVRKLIGGDPNSGVLAVGALPRAGQTMQFQRRDAAAATEDMNELLARAKKQLAGTDDLRRLPLLLQRPRAKSFWRGRTTTPGWCKNSSARSDSPDFSATARSARSAKKIILHGFTASLALFVKK